MSYTFATVISYMGRDGTMQTYSLIPLEMDDTPSPLGSSPPGSPGPLRTPPRRATPISHTPEPASPEFRSQAHYDQATVSAGHEEVKNEEHGLSPSTETREASERKRQYLQWLWMK
ncbi:hypothetical protein LTR27_006424 [Elasticomyces elasticus]|nr:hypothetical protein LTR27_006424 [Elasticomyces elasticus]